LRFIPVRLMQSTSKLNISPLFHRYPFSVLESVGVDFSLILRRGAKDRKKPMASEAVARFF